MNHIIRNSFIFTIIAIPIVTIYICYNIISEHASVTDQNTSPEQVKRAVQYYATVSDRMFTPQENINLKLTQQNIDDVLTVLSHMTPRANFNGRIANSIGVLNGSIDIKNSWFNGYINISCFLTSGTSDGSIQYCLIGDISVPGILVKKLIDISIYIFFNDQVKNTINQLINGIQINNQRVLLTATKNAEFKNDLSTGLKTVASIAKNLKSTNTEFPLPEIINEYLQSILETNWPVNEKSVSLSLVIEQAFKLAKFRSQYNDPRSENEAALWSIAIAFGNYRFAELINANTPEVENTLSKYPKITATLNGRSNLPLHFLYSVVMEILGNNNLSVSIGELKELHDANLGGSGFDFTDLAADKAGSAFSLFLTSNKNDAIRGQILLAKVDYESLFFPDISDLPVPVKGEDFDLIIGSIRSIRYKKFNDIIDIKISELPLYSDKL